ncbi:hypothetical protein BRD17_09390 [Halobacteriales archaeon SW_7_68_16]|nr:MAG: hypothetical protein BRD17_09390 [Halobacteriales archaeon SW_7_68_16]
MQPTTALGPTCTLTKRIPVCTHRLLIYGPTGSGKTTIAQFVPEAVAAHPDIATAYVTGISHEGRTDILHRVHREIRPARRPESASTQ